MAGLGDLLALRGVRLARLRARAALPGRIVDLGANIGAASVFATRWPNARILALEPDPGTFERLAAKHAPVSA